MIFQYATAIKIAGYDPNQDFSTSQYSDIQEGFDMLLRLTIILIIFSPY